MKKLLVCQHVAFEILGTLDPMLRDAGFRIRYVNFSREPDAAPRLDRYHGLVVLGADYGDDPSALPAFIEANDMSYPVLVDDGLADDYEVLVYPTSIVIDRSGRVRYRVEGFTERGFNKLSKVVERLVSES